MAEYIIDKIEYGGNVYKLQDSVSDFLTGAVTALSTTEGQHSTITNQNGAVSIAIPTKTSHLTNDSGFITTDSDEKVKQTPLNGKNIYHGVLFGYGQGGVEVTNTIYTSNKLQWRDSSTPVLTIYNGDGSKYGWISYSNLYLCDSSSTYRGHFGTAVLTANRTYTLPDKTGTIALTSDIPTVSYPVTSVNNKTGAVSLTASDVGALSSTTVIPSKTSDLTNDSGFLTSYTETDPVFSASVAAGITSTDISNWNAKVSDDKTWNGVSLDKTEVSRDQYYIPGMYATTASSAELCKATSTPTARKIALYNANSYLISTTPSANDNSTKVATTAYVDAAIPKVYSSTNTGGYLTMATLPIYDGTVQ